MKNPQKGVDSSLYDMFNRYEPARFNFYEMISTPTKLMISQNKSTLEVRIESIQKNFIIFALRVIEFCY